MQGKDNRIDASSGHDAPAARTFLDVEGTLWHVREQPFGDYDRRSGMSLIFASDAAVRRVRDFPPNWTTLGDEELLALSWKS